MPAETIQLLIEEMGIGTIGCRERREGDEPSLPTDPEHSPNLPTAAAAQPPPLNTTLDRLLSLRCWV